MSDLIAVTGATGFIGRHVVHTLLRQGHQVRVSVRRAAPELLSVECVTGDLRELDHVNNLVRGVDVVVHLAALAHQSDRAIMRSGAMFDVHRDLASQLAQCAADSGVRRLVFASTIGVLGARSPPGQPLTEASVANPDGHYARSKLATERELTILAQRRSFELTIIRPTLAFGPDAPGNVHRLVRLVASGLPLPFGSLTARRSFLGVRNLAALFSTCCIHPMAGGQVFVAADEMTLSVPEIVQILGSGLRRSVRLWAVPRPVLALGAALLGKSGDFEKLAAPLTVDASKARMLLDWQPEQSLPDAIYETGRQFAQRMGL